VTPSRWVVLSARDTTCSTVTTRRPVTLCRVEGSYRLRSQRHGTGHVADVRVAVDLGRPTATHVSDSAFAWLHRSYPNASLVSGWHDELVGAATVGINYALEVVGLTGAVWILEIGYAPADTGPDDVRFAAAFATWDAIGQTPPDLPWIDESGVQFPHTPGIRWTNPMRLRAMPRSTEVDTSPTEQANETTRRVPRTTE
jgi:hypothetical protein